MWSWDDADRLFMVQRAGQWESRGLAGRNPILHSNLFQREKITNANIAAIVSSQVPFAKVDRLPMTAGI